MYSALILSSNKKLISLSLPLITVVLILATIFTSQAQVIIRNYKTYIGTADSGTARLILLRKFDRNQKESYLAINPQTFQSQIISAKNYRINSLSEAQLIKLFANTPYIKALQYADSNANQMADAGINHGFHHIPGICLTIDLCPSHKPLDRNIFTSLFTEFGRTQRPIPLALSLTGSFLKTHIDDIRWLQEQERIGNISITWINHTLRHHYDPKSPLKTNFLLAPGTNLQQEVLGNEIALLEHNIQPSVFFRFPGLISDKKTVDYLFTNGLIPVGTDAWLAKGQATHQGSIVLIHGNGNEPIGVKDFIQLLQQKQKDISNKTWHLYDLRKDL